MTEEKRRQIGRLRLDLLLNCVVCHSKIGETKNWEKIVKYCTLALESEDSPKARYHRAKAYRHLNEIEMAREDLMVAWTLDPRDPRS